MIVERYASARAQQGSATLQQGGPLWNMTPRIKAQNHVKGHRGQRNGMDIATAKLHQMV
jgi:hypothetical protein